MHVIFKFIGEDGEEYRTYLGSYNGLPEININSIINWLRMTHCAKYLFQDVTNEDIFNYCKLEHRYKIQFLEDNNYPYIFNSAFIINYDENGEDLFGNSGIKYDICGFIKEIESYTQTKVAGRMIYGKRKRANKW
jgi:hypothetical protein